MPSPERPDLTPSVAEINNPPVVSHLLRRSERAQKVIDFVRQTQQTDQIIPPLCELAVQFGYSIRSASYISTLLRRAGLSTMRAPEKPSVIPPPSKDLAWMIGVIAAGGHNNLETGKITVASQNDDKLLATVQSVGEGMFAVRATVNTRRINKRNKVYQDNLVIFSNTKISCFLGDLRRDNWPGTVVDQHGWILQNQEYMWSLIRGFFDVRGGIYTYEGKKHVSQHQIFLKTPSIYAINFITELLAQLGLKRLSITRRSSTKSSVVGISIYSLDDIRLFANNIYSVIIDKEAQLDYYRQRFSFFGKQQVYTDEEGVEEFIRITQLLEHHPSSTDISHLKERGGTRFSVTFYATRFGQGSFVKARENLERIIAQRE